MTPNTTMNKITVIHHSSDFDGLFCREIARKFLPDATLIGWDYGDPVPTPDVVSSEDRLYMLDISVDGLMGHPKLIWIDHHKSAMEKFPQQIEGYRIDGVAACRLAWQWFSVQEHNAQHQTNEQLQVSLPTKQDFIDRKVSEPMAVTLAGEHDIWDHHDPDAELFQFGLRSQELTDKKWSHLLSPNAGPDQAIPHPYNTLVLCLLNDGKYVRYADRQAQKDIISKSGFTVDFEGLKFLALNTPQKGSGQFADGIKPEHDALLKFSFTGSVYDISLYHAPGKEHHDLSKIAIKHGGGGHRGACGMRTKTLPFVA